MRPLIIATIVAATLLFHACSSVTKVDRPLVRPLVLQSVRFPDRLHGWVSGSREVYRTADGGKSWQRFAVPSQFVTDRPGTKANLATGQAVWADADTLILRGDRGLLTVTATAGSWKETVIPPDVLVRLDDISLLNGQEGWASASERVYRTADGGATWSLANERVSDECLTSIFPVSSREAWVAGHGGVVAHTVDAGRSWQVQRLKSVQQPISWLGFAPLASIWFNNRERGWACGAKGALFKTRDGGHGWTLQPVPVQDRLSAISFSGQREGWVIGSRHILHTNDGGEHWELQYGNRDAFLADVKAVGDGRVWVVGGLNPRSVMYTKDHGRRWTSMDLK
jgi:photosystem II stability/assembly factor-like uncharacterized protein